MSGSKSGGQVALIGKATVFRDLRDGKCRHGQEFTCVLESRHAKMDDTAGVRLDGKKRLLIICEESRDPGLNVSCQQLPQGRNS